MIVKSRFCLVAIAIGAFIATFAQSTRAQSVALTISPRNAPYVDNVDRVIGWKFNTTVPIDVYELGAFDFGLDGLLMAHEVAIWKSDKTLMVSGTVPAGTSARVADDFRFVKVQQTRLQPFVDYIIAATWPAAGDPYTWMQSAGSPTSEYAFASWGVTGAMYLGGVSPYSEGAATLAFPEGLSPRLSRAHIGPSFTFVPEPTSSGMLILAVFFCKAARRRGTSAA